MNIDIETLAVYLGIVGTLVYWLYNIAIAPTRDKIDDIVDTVSDMRAVLKEINIGLKESERDRRELSEQINRLQAEVENLKSRLDRLESSWTKHLAHCEGEKKC